MGTAGQVPFACCCAWCAANPRAEVGLNDDFSYIYSAKVLAGTGHVAYNGWGAFPLGWQLYLGALFIRVFGFSFTAVRASVLLVALLIAPLSQAILVRLGVRPWNAFLGTLTLVLSPLYLPLAASYMSDVPSLACLLLCVYACLRAMGAGSDRAAVGWLVFAALSNAAGGTVRQVAWLGVLVIVPCTAWYLRHRRGMVLAAALVCLPSFAFIGLYLYWFQHQPYVVVEKLIAVDTGTQGFRARVTPLVRMAFLLLFLQLPVFAGVAWREAFAGTKRRRTALLTGLAVAGAVVLLAALDRRLGWVSALVGDYVTSRGVLSLPWLLGTTPDVLRYRVQALVVCVTLAVAGLALVSLRGDRSTLLTSKTWLHVPMFWLFAPLSAAYLLLLVTRVAIFDRYMLPLLFVCLAVLLKVYERRWQRALPAVCLLPLLVLAAFGIAGTHDLYAAARARVQAADVLRARGVPRDQFRAGFEYDAWTELEHSGFVNEPRITEPAGAYRPWLPPAVVPPPCVFWFSSHTPSIHARFELANQPGVCFHTAAIPPVLYQTWFAPHLRAVYFVEVPPEAR